MNDNLSIANEQAAAKAFNRQAATFDQQFNGDTIIKYKRKRVREHVMQFLRPQSSILELNAGTGEDAIFFAENGHTVHATDISEGMQQQLSEKARQSGLQMRIGNEKCSFTELDNLANTGPFDMVFSNFAGLNCTDQLSKVLASFDRLVKPGGYVTLVLLPKFCLWEFMLLFKGKCRAALRRFSGRRGSPAHIEGEQFRCWYYNPSFIHRQLARNFEICSLEGLCVLVPPSYMQGFAEKYPRIYRTLVARENSWKSTWPWKLIGDYYIITLKKNKPSKGGSDL